MRKSLTGSIPDSKVGIVKNVWKVDGMITHFFKSELTLNLIPIFTLVPYRVFIAVSAASEGGFGGCLNSG